jgi:hypothetical protein
MTARRVYERVDDSMTFPEDAVIVGIGWEPELEPLADATANVSWGDGISMGDRLVGASEGPYTVPEALARADEIAALYGLPRVMISIERPSYWRADWGDLVEP